MVSQMHLIQRSLDNIDDLESADMLVKAHLDANVHRMFFFRLDTAKSCHSE